MTIAQLRYIVAPNLFHHIFLKDYKTAYPNASVIGPETLNAKKEPEGFKLDQGDYPLVLATRGRVADSGNFQFSVIATPALSSASNLR